MVLGLRRSPTPNAALHDDLMAASNELIPRGQQGEAMSLFLDFFGKLAHKAVAEAHGMDHTPAVAG